MIDLFNVLVKYYISRNLPVALRNLEEGRVNSIYDVPHEQGEENKYVHGVVIFADGDTLARRLISDRVIKDMSSPEFISLKENGDLEKYLMASRRYDGAFFYNGCENSIARANWVNDEPDGSEEIAKRYRHVMERRHLLVPSDFVVEGAPSLSLKEFENNVGRRTNLALLVPYAYTSGDSLVTAYQIKQSAWGDLGMGTVNKYNSHGLCQRFVMRHEPESAGPFIETKNRISGYVQQLKPHEGRVRVVEEQRVSADMLADKA